MPQNLTESQIVSACLEWLQWKGIMAWRTNNTGVYDPGRGVFRSFRGRKGVSDIIGIVQGKFLACEVKRPGKKPTADQTSFLEEINRRGGIGMWVTSVEEMERDLTPHL